MKQPVVIKVFKDGNVENVKQFQDGQIVIGTNDNNQISLEGLSISPIHAVIEERDNGYYICDLGSESGTFIDGNKVFDQVIESGQVVTIGDYQIEFFVGVPKPAAPPTPPPAAKESKSSDSMLGEPVKDVPGEKTTVVTDNQEEIVITKEPSSPTPPPIKDSKPAKSVEPPKAQEPPKVEEPPKQVEFKEDDSLATSEDKTEVIAQPVAYDTSKGTYAPPSEMMDLASQLKPGKGPIVEIIVAWKERVIGTYHFKEEGDITIGSTDKCDIQVPLVGVAKAEHTLIRMGTFATVCFTPEMAGFSMKDNMSSPIADLQKKNRIRRTNSGFELDLEQEEMICLSMFGETINIYVRYTNDVPKPALAPFLDMSASEVTGVVLSIVLGVIFSLYMMIYTPQKLEDEKNQEEALRMAKVVFKIPKRARKKKVVKITDKTPQVKAPKKKEKQKKKKVATTRKKDPGKAAALKKMPNRKKTKKVTSVIKKGGGVKLSKNRGSNMKAPPKKTAKNTGLLSAFGKGGAQKKLNQAYDGAGGLLGMANEATGYSGSSETRAGESFGGTMKASGAGGRGKSLIGGGGINTSGRGTGNWGSGSGGIGRKGNVDINVSGEEVEVEGFIDKEAIRRVIQRNRRTIQLCYERQLNRKKDLYGKIKIAWTIEEEGRVGTARAVQNSLAGREGRAVASCIVNKLKGWKFPEPPPGQVAEVEYPFIFSSQ